jgi:multidrug efflux system membrane fusion protein
MKRSIWILAFLVVVGLFAGFQQYQSWSLNKPQDNPQAPAERSGGQGQGRAGNRARGETVPVLVATAVQKNIPLQLRAVGNVEAYATVSIKSQVTGVIYKIHFKEGDDVKKNQLLFTIDPRPFEAAVKQADANLARDVAQLNNAREQAKRYADLVDKQYVSREQYDQIRTNADAAQAVVDADKAAVENAKVQLSYCFIYSPVEGRVGSFLINEGNLVRVNDGTPLVVINQVSPIFVSFAVPEQYLTALKQNMGSGKLLIDASFPSDDGRPEQGRLEFIDNAVDRSTGTVRLKGVFSNGERRLWPGQFVNAALTMSTQGDAVVIPSESIQVGPEGQQVFVVSEDKRVEQRLVTVGQTQQGESIITKGLAAGEMVVREGQFLLGPGSRVDIKEPVKVDDAAKGEARKGRAKSKTKAEERGAS